MKNHYLSYKAHFLNLQAKTKQNNKTFFFQQPALQTTPEAMLHASGSHLKAINASVDNQQTRVKSSSFFHTTVE